MQHFLIKTIILICILFFHQIKSNAIDSGYSGDKPLFVEITTDWCFACKYLEPTVEELKREYGEKVIFVRLNATSEETIYEAQQIAASYGILEFFNNNRNAFPRVAIYCPGALSPKENLLGANKRDIYTGILDNLLLNASSVCSIGGRPPITATSGDGRPEKEEQIEVASRPDLAEFLERPLGVTGSGRPNELTFWTYGIPMPLGVYFYSRALTLPECAGGNQVLCYKGDDINKPSQVADTQPVFKPYNPNATRNEKGYKYVN